MMMFLAPSLLRLPTIMVPIVLVFLAAALAVMSFLINRKLLAWWTIAALAVGAIACFTAVATLQSSRQLALGLPAAAVALWEAHHAWAELAAVTDVIAAVLAMGALAVSMLPAALEKWHGEAGQPKRSIPPGLVRSAHAVAAVLAVVACVFIVQ